MRRIAARIAANPLGNGLFTLPMAACAGFRHPQDRSEVEKIRGLYPPTPDGKAVPFESFSKLKIQPGFVAIPHYHQLRMVTVKAYAPFGELLSRIQDRARPGLTKIKLEPGYEMRFAGEDEELRKNKAEMGLVMQISLALIAFDSKPRGHRVWGVFCCVVLPSGKKPSGIGEQDHPTGVYAMPDRGCGSLPQALGGLLRYYYREAA